MKKSMVCRSSVRRATRSTVAPAGTKEEPRGPSTVPSARYRAANTHEGGKAGSVATSLTLRPAMIEGDHTFASVTDKISDVTLKKRTPFHWFIGFTIAFMIAQLLLFTTIWLLANGIGVWGNNQPVGWAFDIINFVFWVGIGHAGTLISAILLLFRARWRNAGRPARRSFAAVLGHHPSAFLSLLRLTAHPS